MFYLLNWPKRTKAHNPTPNWTTHIYSKTSTAILCKPPPLPNWKGFPKWQILELQSMLGLVSPSTWACVLVCLCACQWWGLAMTNCNWASDNLRLGKWRRNNGHNGSPPSTSYINSYMCSLPSQVRCSSRCFYRRHHPWGRRDYQRAQMELSQIYCRGRTAVHWIIAIDGTTGLQCRWICNL